MNLDSQNNRINIGRGHDSQIILNDLSVSRIHCILKINKSNKKVFISDNNSKFGTIILIQTNKIIMNIGLKLHLQIGRTYLEFLNKGSSNIFGCFEVSEKNNPNFYYLQNKSKIPELGIKSEIDSDLCENSNKNLEKFEKIVEYENLNTNPNLNEDNLEEILLTPLKSIKPDDLNYVQEKNEESKIINKDNNTGEKKSEKNIINNLNANENKEK